MKWKEFYNPEKAKTTTNVVCILGILIYLISVINLVAGGIFPNRYQQESVVYLAFILVILFFIITFLLTQNKDKKTKSKIYKNLILTFILLTFGFLFVFDFVIYGLIKVEEFSGILTIGSIPVLLIISLVSWIIMKLSG